MIKEKKIIFEDNTYIDDAVEMLLKEEKKGNHVYGNFNGVILHSNTVTLDSAYLALFGCTKEEYDKRKEKEFARNHEEENKIDPNLICAENALQGMKISKLLFLTRDGEFFSFKSYDYIEKMSKYSVYCRDDKKEQWTKKIKSLILKAGDVSDNYILTELRSLEYTGIIMEKMANGESTKAIKNTISDQVHTGYTISLLGQNMINFSPYGLEFAEQYIGKYATNSDSELCKVYKKEKQKKKVMI